MIESWRISNFF